LIVRVTIKTRQEDGLLPSKKLHFVDCTVLFSEEEKEIIKARGLGQHYFVVDSEMPPPAGSHRLLSIWLRVLAPFVLLTGCVTGLGTTIAGNSRGGDALTGFCFFAAVAMYLGGIAMKRHVHLADQPQQNITLQRLLGHPSFSIYALDNARAKTIGEELRVTLARVKDGLLVNRDIEAAETFEL
jgi:hypothetical protein